MSRRTIITTTLVLLILAISTVSAAALVSGPPIADAYVYQTNPDTNYNNNYLYVRGDTTSCTQTQVAYLRWDLSTLTDPSVAQYAGITLKANFTSGAPAQTQVTMYKVANDTWDEATIKFNGAPPRGDVLDAKTITVAGLVTFSAPAILTYLQQEANVDNFATIALAMTGNCTATATTVRFDSAEPATGGVAPSLDLRTTAPPTAVHLSTASAKQAATWPLYAGLGALALIVAGGLAISRRRAAVR